MSWFGSKPSPKGIIRPSISASSNHWSWGGERAERWTTDGWINGWMERTQPEIKTMEDMVKCPLTALTQASTLWGPLRISSKPPRGWQTCCPNMLGLFLFCFVCFCCFCLLFLILFSQSSAGKLSCWETQQIYQHTKLPLYTFIYFYFVSSDFIGRKMNQVQAGSLV